MRDWDTVLPLHRAFWHSENTRPLLAMTVDHYVDTELTAAAYGNGYLTPERIQPDLLLDEYVRMAESHAAIGDDFIAVSECQLGIPWLEAICGCRVKVVDGKSLWPEAPAEPFIGVSDHDIHANPWFCRLREVLETVARHAAGRYAVGMPHLRGPADTLIALMGSGAFFDALLDRPEWLRGQALEVARIWRRVVDGLRDAITPYHNGYGIRQFGIWSPGLSVWLQDDTSSMISARHYQAVFLSGLETMFDVPYGVLHLHVQSKHHALTFGAYDKVRAINIYLDDLTKPIADAMPTLQRLQALDRPLILAKDVYQGFSLAEYEELMAGLRPNGLRLHVNAPSLEDAREIFQRLTA
jgi:hypothetical protein